MDPLPVLNVLGAFTGGMLASLLAEHLRNRTEVRRAKRQAGFIVETLIFAALRHTRVAEDGGRDQSFEEFHKTASRLLERKLVPFLVYYSDQQARDIRSALIKFEQLKLDEKGGLEFSHQLSRLIGFDAEAGDNAVTVSGSLVELKKLVGG